MFPQFPSLWCVNSLNPLMASSRLQDNIMKKLTEIANLLGFTRSKSYYRLFLSVHVLNFLSFFMLMTFWLLDLILILLHNLRNNTDFSYSLSFLSLKLPILLLVFAFLKENTHFSHYKIHVFLLPDLPLFLWIPYQSYFLWRFSSCRCILI